VVAGGLCNYGAGATRRRRPQEFQAQQILAVALVVASGNGSGSSVNRAALGGSGSCNCSLSKIGGVIMAHWAEIDENSIVIRVTVGDNNDSNGDEGYQWLIDNLGGVWIKTSYNTHGGVHQNGGTPLRKNYAGIGYMYDPIRDAFIPPQPEFGEWVLNEDTCLLGTKYYLTHNIPTSAVGLSPAIFQPPSIQSSDVS
jgi:hypothetical protein